MPPTTKRIFILACFSVGLDYIFELFLTWTVSSITDPGTKEKILFRILNKMSFLQRQKPMILYNTAYLFSKDQRENSYTDSQQKGLHSQYLTCSLGRVGEGWVRGGGCRGWRGGPPAGPAGSAARATAGSPACSGTPTQETSTGIREI